MASCMMFLEESKSRDALFIIHIYILEYVRRQNRKTCCSETIHIKSTPNLRKVMTYGFRTAKAENRNNDQCSWILVPVTSTG